MKIKRISKSSDAKKAKRGDLVCVRFMSWRGDATLTHSRVGIFYSCNGNDISLLEYISDEKNLRIRKVGKVEYAWKGQSYNINTNFKFPFKEGSRNYRRYESLLGRTGDVK